MSEEKTVEEERIKTELCKWDKLWEYAYNRLEALKNDIQEQTGGKFVVVGYITGSGEERE
jgi:hypothetical protein